MNTQPVAAPHSRTHASKIGKWLLPALLVAVGAILSLAADPGRAQGTVAQETLETKRAVVQFASIGYLPSNGGNPVRVAAKDVSRIQLIRSTDKSECWLELFYHSDDYLLQKVDGVIFYKRDGTLEQMKVSVNLVGPEGIGFPFVN